MSASKRREFFQGFLEWMEKKEVPKEDQLFFEKMGNLYLKELKELEK